MLNVKHCEMEHGQWDLTWTCVCCCIALR